MYFRLNEERFRMSSVTRFSKGGFSIHTKKWYLHVWFGTKERQFVYDTEEDLDYVVKHLDTVFKVQDV